MFLEEKKVATFYQVQAFAFISFFSSFFLRCSRQLICHIVVFKDELRMLWKEVAAEELLEDLE